MDIKDLGNDVKEVTDDNGLIDRGVTTESTKDEVVEKKKNKLWLILLLFLLSTIVVISIVVVNYKKVGDYGEGGLNIGIDSNIEDIGGGKSKEEIQAELNKKVEEGMMNVSMNTNIVLKDGKSKANLKITNRESNRYMQFIEIYTKEDNKLVYRSGAIPIGKSVNEAKLNVVLKKGTYDCVAYFNALDAKGENIVGKVGVNVTINVLN